MPSYNSIGAQNHYGDYEQGHGESRYYQQYLQRGNDWKGNLLSSVGVLALAFIAGDWVRMRIFPGEFGINSSNKNNNKIRFNNNSANGKKAIDDSWPVLVTDNNAMNDEDINGVIHNGKEMIAMPTGVNLGSWLSLEDWFYVGHSGAVEVATPDDGVAGTCLPPLHLDSSTGPRWNSETDLLSGLANHYHNKERAAAEASGGDTAATIPGPYAQAIKVIHAFRLSYLDMERDLRTMVELGIKYVRVPISWCWTDEDPSTILTRTKGENGEEQVSILGEEEVKEKFTCADPFHEGVRWPAIPRSLLEKLLRACAKHGLQATLDIHTYPGGTSIGTFSGVWPRFSRFWTHGDAPATDHNQKPDIGRNLLKDFISWLESLAINDPEAFRGLRALSPMNEPAHLAGLFDGESPIITDKETFLPPLPKHMARKYLAELNKGLDASSDELTMVPDGNHLRVFLWLRDAIDAFRQSSLPLLGKELHVNVHESIFPQDVLPDREKQYEYGNDPGALKVFGAWWRATTTPQERSTWAILDIHHYHAWGPFCSGTVEGPPVGRYTCSDEETKSTVLGGCSKWASVYRTTLEHECEPGLRLASAEFSASTHHSVRHACNDVSTLKQTFEMQVEAAREADVELFWWSFHMPHGGAFRRAWSFKHLMYTLGVLEKPDASDFHCGDHVTPSGEPDDMGML